MYIKVVQFPYNDMGIYVCNGKKSTIVLCELERTAHNIISRRRVIYAKLLYMHFTCIHFFSLLLPRWIVFFRNSENQKLRVNLQHKQPQCNKKMRWNYSYIVVWMHHRIGLDWALET